MLAEQLHGALERLDEDGGGFQGVLHYREEVKQMGRESDILMSLQFRSHVSYLVIDDDAALPRMRLILIAAFVSPKTILILDQNRFQNSLSHKMYSLRHHF